MNVDRVILHKIKVDEKDSSKLSRRRQWPLEDLKLIDGISEQSVRLFCHPEHAQLISSACFSHQLCCLLFMWRVLVSLLLISRQSNREFILLFEKAYRWISVDSAEKHSFLYSLWKVGAVYGVLCCAVCAVCGVVDCAVLCLSAPNAPQIGTKYLDTPCPMQNVKQQKLPGAYLHAYVHPVDVAVVCAHVCRGG